MDKYDLFLLLSIIICFFNNVHGGIDQRGVFSRTSIDVGNVISVTIPDNPDEVVDVDQLTNDFRRQLVRIKNQNLREKVEHGWTALEESLPSMTFVADDIPGTYDKNDGSISEPGTVDIPINHSIEEIVDVDKKVQKPNIHNVAKVSKNKNKQSQESKNEGNHRETSQKTKAERIDGQLGSKSMSQRELLRKLCLSNQSTEDDTTDGKNLIAMKNMHDFDRNYGNSETYKDKENTAETPIENAQSDESLADGTEFNVVGKLTNHEDDIRRTLMQQLAHLKSYVSKKLRESFPDMAKINRKRSFKNVPTKNLKVYSVDPESLRLKRNIYDKQISEQLSRGKSNAYNLKPAGKLAKLSTRRSPKKLKKSNHVKPDKYIDPKARKHQRSSELASDFKIPSLAEVPRTRINRAVKADVKEGKLKSNPTKTLEQKTTTTPVPSSSDDVVVVSEKNVTKSVDTDIKSTTLVFDASTNEPEKVTSIATTTLNVEALQDEIDESVTESYTKVENKSLDTTPLIRITHENLVELGPIYPLNKVNLGSLVFNVRKIYLGRQSAENTNDTNTDREGPDHPTNTLIIEMIPMNKPHLSEDLPIDLQELRNIAALAATPSHNHDSDKTSNSNENVDVTKDVTLIRPTSEILITNELLKSSIPMNRMLYNIQGTNLDHMTQSMNKSSKIDIATILGVQNKTFQSRISGSINATLNTTITKQNEPTEVTTQPSLYDEQSRYTTTDSSAIRDGENNMQVPVEEVLSISGADDASSKQTEATADVATTETNIEDNRSNNKDDMKSNMNINTNINANG